MKKPLKYIGILFLCFIHAQFLAQGLTDSLIHKMYDLWDNSYGSYQVDHMDGEVDNATQYFKIKDSSFQLEDLKAQILQAESELVNKDWGLDWSAGYLYNTAPGMDVADNILYKSRIQTQVSWDLLDNGLIENKTRSKILENKSAIASLNIDETSLRNQDILDNWHKIIYRFNLDKIEILDQRLKVAEQRVAISYQLKSLGKITHEELLNNLESYAEISSLYKIYQDYNDNIGEDVSVDEEPLPLLDINYIYSLNGMESEASDTVKQLMLENLELSNKFYNEIDLKLYSRYNYYDLINNPLENRAFLTVGVGLGVPLNFQKKEKEKLMDLKKQEILLNDVQLSTEEVQLKNDLLNYLYEFRYKLKQFNTFYYKKLKLDEMLRKEQARYDVNILDFNPLKALRWLDESMSVDIELIDLKQQLYLYVLRIISVAPHLDVNKLIVPLELADLEIEKVQKAPKEVYVWSKTIQNHEVDVLINYCLINNISKVVVSAAADKAKLNDFTQRCAANSIPVEIMIGDNKLISDYSQGNLEAKVKGIDWSTVDGLHLDVEPQTFDDWKDKKEYYTTEYLKMYSFISAWCDAQGLNLSVSLPTYFSADAVGQIQANGGLVYFMCYENVTSSFLQKKLSGYIGSEFVIALRPEDFNNMAEVEIKMEELSNQLSVTTFIIHDLERLLKFDP